MIHYNVTMQHTEETFESLAHMQYDLFCKSNLIVRSILSFGLLLVGILNFESWWGILIIFYASYLNASKYASANHTARKLSKQLKAADMPFPSSRYVFRDNAMETITLPEGTTLGEPLMYKEVARMGEDAQYFYLFRNQYGGYMMPKEQLGEKAEDFRRFLEAKTGQQFVARSAPVVKFLRKFQKNKR